MRALRWLTALALLAVLCARCSSTPASPPTMDECCNVEDGQFANCALCPNVHCGRAEGTSCPDYDYGCEGGVMWMQSYDCPDGGLGGEPDSHADVQSLLGDGALVDDAAGE